MAERGWLPLLPAPPQLKGDDVKLRRKIGMAILVSLFVGIYISFALASGWLVALIPFAFAAVVLAVVATGVILIDP